MITVQNLKKSFGPKVAVNGISFTVEKGEVLGFLGPNGAGKSTTMRMITGFIPPTAGTIRIGSFDMLEQPIEAKLSRHLKNPDTQRQRAAASALAALSRHAAYISGQQSAASSEQSTVDS